MYGIPHQGGWLKEGRGEQESDMPEEWAIDRAYRAVDLAALPKRLKSTRLRLGLTQQEFGEAIGYSRSQINLIEIARYVPGNRFLSRLEAIYGINKEWLLYGKEDCQQKDRTIASNAMEKQIDGKIDGQENGQIDGQEDSREIGKDGNVSATTEDTKVILRFLNDHPALRAAMANTIRKIYIEALHPAIERSQEPTPESAQEPTPARS